MAQTIAAQRPALEGYNQPTFRETVRLQNRKHSIPQKPAETFPWPQYTRQFASVEHRDHVTSQNLGVTEPNMACFCDAHATGRRHKVHGLEVSVCVSR
jgi:hypothetical protein